MVEAADVVDLKDGRLAFGDRVLWDHLDLKVRAGEFIAVLGPNGTGKTSLLKVLLGELPLTAGTVAVAGRPVTEGSDLIGYVPQHRSVDRGLTLRGQDLGRAGPGWASVGLDEPAAGRPVATTRGRADGAAAGERRPPRQESPSA